MRTLATLVCVALGAVVQLAAAADAPPPSAKQEQGHAVFKRWCEPCHGRASYLPATAGLAIKYKGKIPAALEDRNDLTVDAVKTFVRTGAFSMPPFRKTEVSDADLDALAAYLAAKGRH
jgi:mono/diheme cytochrome c family protein